MGWSRVLAVCECVCVCVGSHPAAWHKSVQADERLSVLNHRLSHPNLTFCLYLVVFAVRVFVAWWNTE